MLPFPRVDEREDVPTLRVGKVAHLLDEASRLCRIVVLHGRFEVLAKRNGLTELPS